MQSGHKACGESSSGASGILFNPGDAAEHHTTSNTDDEEWHIEG